jgi:hypothetical protein
MIIILIILLLIPVYSRDLTYLVTSFQKIPNSELEHCVHSIYNREIETNIKKSIDLYTLVLDSVQNKIIKESRIFSREYLEKNQTELIRIDEEFTLEKLFKLVTSLREGIRLVDVVDKLNISNQHYDFIAKYITPCFKSPPYIVDKIPSLCRIYT